MASYTIISNALSGTYVDKYTGETITFENETYHPGLLQNGISRFKVTFADDAGNSVTQEHEVASTDAEEIAAQLRDTLVAYNSQNGSYTAPELATDQPVTL